MEREDERHDRRATRSPDPCGLGPDCRALCRVRRIGADGALRVLSRRPGGWRKNNSLRHECNRHDLGLRQLLLLQMDSGEARSHDLATAASVFRRMSRAEIAFHHKRSQKRHALRQFRAVVAEHSFVFPLVMEKSTKRETRGSWPSLI